jgi:hypothetical protein
LITPPQLNAQELRKVLRVLNSIEEEGVKDLRANLKTALGPTASKIASQVGGPPLSGFVHRDRTRWTKVSGKVSFTPGKSRENEANLVSLRIVPAGDGRGLFIAELAGYKSKGYTASGRALIQNLNMKRRMIGRGGRHAYADFRKERPDVMDKAIKILNQTFKKIEKKL